MECRRAAEAVGLNPETAAYTKSKPRVRAYMLEHRAAVREKLVDQEAEGLRKLNIGRDQILDRLWELATLSHEATRGSIAGQMKAIAMIVAIEGLIPDRRSSPSGTQPATTPVKAAIYEAEWLRKQKQKAAGEEPDGPVATPEVQPGPPQAPAVEPAPNPANDTSSPSVANPFTYSGQLNRVPEATGFAFDAHLDQANSLRRSFSRDRRFSGPRR